MLLLNCGYGCIPKRITITIRWTRNLRTQWSAQAITWTAHQNWRKVIFSVEMQVILFKCDGTRIVWRQNITLIAYNQPGDKIGAAPFAGVSSGYEGYEHLAEIHHNMNVHDCRLYLM